MINIHAEQHGYYFEDLEVNMSAVYAKTVTEADIVLFSGVSGDTNPVHLDAEFAAQTRFGERIAHGMLTASFISAVFGTRLPGPGCIYLSQNLSFRAPVHIGDTVVTRATVTALKPRRQHVSMETVCSVGDTVVLEGEALLYVPPRPEAAD